MSSRFSSPGPQADPRASPARADEASRPTISQYNRRVAVLRRAFLDGVQLDPQSESLDEILKSHPRLVVAANHGPTFGPLASSLGMMQHLDEIGHGHRRFFGVTWRGFYKFPVTRDLAKLMSGSAGVFSVAQYAKTLREGPYNDFMVMPEGDNCNFGDGLEVQPFLSHGFIEIAVRAGVPVLIAANQGTEAWAKVVPVHDEQAPLLGRLLSTPIASSLMPARWRERLDDTGQFSITNPLRGRIAPLRLSFALFEPNLRLEDLAHDKGQRREQLAEQGEQVRAKMREMVRRMAALA